MFKKKVSVKKGDRIVLVRGLEHTDQRKHHREQDLHNDPPPTNSNYKYGHQLKTNKQKKDKLHKKIQHNRKTMQKACRNRWDLGLSWDQVNFEMMPRINVLFCSSSVTKNQRHVI